MTHSLLVMPKEAYTPEELAMFQQIIEKKLAQAQQDMHHLSLLKPSKDNADKARIKNLEEGAEDYEAMKTELMIMRQKKFIDHLEAALYRIQQGTYGICVATGKLIDKERLKAVPHTTHTIEAKNNRDTSI